jgi:hypothetical protein
MRKIDPEQDFIADPKESDRKQFKVGDRVTFTMPWMGGRSVLVTAKIKEIDPLQAFAELELLGFWGGGDDTAIEKLQNLTPYTKEDQEYEDSFNEDTPTTRPADEGFPPKESLKAYDEKCATDEATYAQAHGYVDQDTPSKS